MFRISAIIFAVLVLIGAPTGTAAQTKAKCYDAATCNAECFRSGWKRNCNKVCTHRSWNLPACK
jgi:hypothetical protein